jgi:hypothetical protein
MLNRREYGRKKSRPNFRYYYAICLDGLRKSTKILSIICILSAIRPRHYFNTSQNCNFLNQLAHLSNHSFFPLFFDYCCSLLEYRALVKRFVSLQWVGKLGRESARRKAATYTGKHKHRLNINRHPCPEWDSNPEC